MEISKRDWKRYIDLLSAIDKKAADTMQFWMQENPDADVEELIWVAQNIAGRYGEAAGALACEMYDAVAAAQGAAVPPAEIADIPDYGETAKAVRGTLKNKQNTVPATVGRLVKRVGADTMLKNAARDHVQFAWVPMGDTCAFCMTLASRGWQYISKQAMKHGHAEHIHANCDCTYAIRFDEESTVEGYDPKRYREMYDNAEGGTPQEKINSMRRDMAAKKRAAYAKKEFYSVIDGYRRDATPGKGTQAIAKGRKPKNREADNMELIHREFGGDISLISESNIPGTNNPDYQWRGKVWEEQEPQAHTKNAVDANIREAIHQISDNPGGIVLDVGNSNMPQDEIAEIVLKRLRRSSPFDCDVMIIRNGKIENIYHYHKNKK